jgi:hypothetical protein
MLHYTSHASHEDSLQAVKERRNRVGGLAGAAVLPFDNRLVYGTARNIPWWWKQCPAFEASPAEGFCLRKGHYYNSFIAIGWGSGNLATKSNAPTGCSQHPVRPHHHPESKILTVRVPPVAWAVLSHPIEINARMRPW